MRILVVEDDAHVAAAVQRGLESEGYAVDVAGTATEGHWMPPEHAYDAMVLDVMLPGMSGDAVCTALREAGAGTPILMLTARAGAAEEAHALDAGADDFLSKPFSFLVLQARLRALVRRGGAERPPVLTAGDLRLDPAPHRVGRGETPSAAALASSLCWSTSCATPVTSSEAADPRACLGLHLRGGPEHRRGLRPTAAAAHRRAVRQAAPRDRSRVGYRFDPGGG